MMFQVVKFDNRYNNQPTPQPKAEPKVEAPVQSIMNMDFFTNNTTSVSVPVSDFGEPGQVKRGRGRPRKERKIVDGQEIIVPDDDNDNQLQSYQTNEPYMDSYGETNNMLKSSIMQIDMLQSDIKVELDQIRASKTLKKKYDYLSLLSGTASSLIGTKVTAIREMNKTITDVHNLELKRIKDLKISENEVDDDKRIMDMYNAFISTPVGTYGNNAAMGAIPTLQDMTLINPGDGIIRTNMMGPSNYAINPMVSRMVTMENPNIKTVVVYDPSSGRRWFDVIDNRTGDSVTGVDKPDPMFLEDTTIDVRNGIARNTNLDTTYPLIVLNSTMNEY